MRNAASPAADRPDVRNLVAVGSYEQLVQSPVEGEADVAGLISDDNVPCYRRVTSARIGFSNTQIDILRTRILAIVVKYLVIDNSGYVNSRCDEVRYPSRLRRPPKVCP
jgi:hypothetical protein